MTLAANSQNQIDAYMDGNQLCIEDVQNPNATWYQYHVQNADQLNEYVWFWSQSTDTCIVSPYCNVRVGRTAFAVTGPVPSNYVKLEKLSIASKIWWDGELNVILKGGWDEVRVTMYDIGGKQVKFQEGWEIIWDQEGMKVLHPFLRYGSINHPRVVRLEYSNGECQGVLTKIIYI